MTKLKTAPADRGSMIRLVLPVAALLLATLAMVPFRDRLDKAHITLVYLIVVLGSSLAGRLAGIGAGLLSFLLFNFLFLPPLYTFVVSDPLDWLVLASFLATSLVATELLHRERVQTRLANERRAEIDELATLGSETLNAARAEYALHAIADVIRKQVSAERCDLFSADADSSAMLASATAVPTDDANRHEPLDGLVSYVAKSGRPALARRDETVTVLQESSSVPQLISTGALALAVPLLVRGEIVGVLRISSRNELSLTSEKYRILDALAYYAALGLQRLRLEKSEETAEELRRLDRLKDGLLAAVSHDLRTPLTTIKAVAHEIAASGSTRATIIEQEADQLSDLVDGLLDLSQLNANAMPINIQLNTVDELIGAALQRSGVAVAGRAVNVTQPDELLVGRFDFSHTLRILVNLVENAAKYSEAQEPIEITARRAGASIEVEVADRGPGVSPDEQERIFEPFYRAGNRPPDVRGAGLGLSISRQLARRQGGDVRVHAREGGGSVFTLVIPGAEGVV